MKHENLNSAVSDHYKRETDIMDWDKARVIHTEEDRHKQ